MSSKRDLDARSRDEMPSRGVIQQCLASLAEMFDAYGLIARVAMKVSRKFDNGSFASEA